MKTKHKDIDGSKRLFEVEIPSDIVKKKYEEIRSQIAKIAHIPGYRKGKVPKDLLEKHHGGKIKEETIQDLVAHSYRHALRESDTDTVGIPEVSELNFDLEKGLSFKVKVDIRPKVNLKRYKKIPVKKQKVDIKSEDVDKYLNMLQESNATFTDIKDKAVALGDYIVCDLECLVDSKAIYPKRKGVWVFVDKSNPIPSLIDGLMGLEIGQTKEIQTTLPGDFDAAEYRNKPALFKINLLNIKEKQLPKLDADFAKKLGGCETIEELKTRVKNDLAMKLENKVKQDMVNQIIDTLLKEANLVVPNNLVEKETKRLMESKKDDMTEEKAKEDAINRVKIYFIIDEIARRENIKINNEELGKVIESLAKQYNKTKDELTEHYTKNNLIEGLRDQLKESRVIEILLNNANVKE